MAHTLIDSNVIIDFITADPKWFEWSAQALNEAAGQLAINPIIYAEISVQYDAIEHLEQLLLRTGIAKLNLPWEAAFLAGKCFTRYRRNGGIKRSPLPDFFIGAHAAVQSMTLVTRDTARYRTYFPRVNLIAPDV